MASVSQYSMRRYPIAGPDQPPVIGSSAFYVTANQKVTVLPEKCNKKTWGQRLKITKTNEKLQNENNEIDFNLLHQKSIPSSLSKSMKYVDTTNIYGTVRGVPMPGNAIFSPFPHEVAVVICSCAEYLNGTKRDIKKPSICKKCRGSRLPLAPIGGTVRIKSSPSIVQITRNSAGTMRLPFVSSKKSSRPSILDSVNDPYDLVRRSRLVSPELKSIKNVGTSKDLIKKRAKSISPLRGRPRLRNNRTPSPNENSKNTVNRSRSANRLKSSIPRDGKECWIDKFDPLDPGGRRSILQYEINPYELISKNNSSSEFTPVNDDNLDYDLKLHSRKYENFLNLVYNKNNPTNQNLNGHSHKNNNYNNVNSNNNNNNNNNKNSTTSYSSSSSTTNTTVSGVKTQKLKRSHVKDKKNEVIYEHVNVNLNLDQPKLKHSNSLPNGNEENPLNLENVSLYQITTTDIGIKSILKRPTSVSFPINHDQMIMTSMSNSADDKMLISSSNNYIKSTNIDKNINLVNLNNTNINSNNNNNNGKSRNIEYREKTNNSSSHFYLPLPPRKKVQFVVENDVIINESTTTTTEVTIISNSGLNNLNEEEEEDDEDDINTCTIVNVVDDGEEGDDDDDDDYTNNYVICNSADMKNYEKLNNEIDEYEKIAVIKQEEKPINKDMDEPLGTSTVLFPRHSYLRRSFSERNKNSRMKMNVSFLDTMALRQKNKNLRRDSRHIFPSNSDCMLAPSEPNPDYSENEKSDSSSSCTYDDDNIYEDYNATTINVIVNNLKSDSKTKSSTSSTKTVVNVPSLIINKESPAVHRLEIKHKDNDDDEMIGQKKTSILINGNECYSTVNINDDNTQIYQSSVVVNDNVSDLSGILKSSTNTITISVGSSSSTQSSPTSSLQRNISSSSEIINKINKILKNDVKSVISVNGNDNDEEKCNKHGPTLITLDYNKESVNDEIENEEKSLKKILRNPVEAVRKNLVPHVCGKNPTNDDDDDDKSSDHINKILKDETILNSVEDCNNFIQKLLEDPTLQHVTDGLNNQLIIKLLEKSLIRLRDLKNDDKIGTKDEIKEVNLDEGKEEKIVRFSEESKGGKDEEKDKDSQSNRDSVSSGNSYSSAIYERYDFDNNGDLSDCYQSCSSELTAEEDGSTARSQFYQMLADATLSEIEISNNTDDDHHYESIRLGGGDPIYEEIGEIPPPLPLTAPPDVDLEKKNLRSMFEGASKYDILSYLVDAKERGLVPEESTYSYNFNNSNDIILEEESSDKNKILIEHEHQNSDINSRISHDSSLEENSSLKNEKNILNRKGSIEIERNDSGVGSETSKSSRSRFQILPNFLGDTSCPIHLCEDCDDTVETQISDSGVMFAPLVCRKCAKKRAERKEIITEIVETEEKYGRDLQIILEEFYQPMLVAGLLTQEQLSAIFLNAEELLENNQALSERMRDALDIASEQGDDDLLTVNIGRLFLDASPMLHAFESYCVRQAASSLLLANLEKEKELLRIFLRVSQMENTVLRRMNLNSFLMVPVQRVTKYPLLLARLYKVTPSHCEGRDSLKQAQEKIELHLNHMNREAKDVPTKLWRRISSSSPNRRASCEMDMIKIKLRKMAVDILEWNHDEVRFAVEGKLLFTQPTDNNWRKGRTIKLTPIHALLVTNGKPTQNYKADRAQNEILNFPRHTGIREASLLLVREKAGRYTLLREPLYLDRCIVCTEAEWDDYFEVQEISSKDTFIFKGEDGMRTKYWYTQLQYHAQGMGAWRKRRSALANIMINGMMTRQ